MKLKKILLFSLGVAAVVAALLIVKTRKNPPIEFGPRPGDRVRERPYPPWGFGWVFQRRPVRPVC